VVKAEEGRSPQDDEPFVERFGLIVMITTGESILALIVGGSGVFQQQYDYYLLVQLAFVTMFYMAKLYFASNTELHEGHALVEDGVPGGVTWAFATESWRTLCCSAALVSSCSLHRCPITQWRPSITGASCASR